MALWQCFSTFCSQQSLLDQDCPNWNNQGNGFVSQNPGNQYSPCPPLVAFEHNMQNQPRPLMGGPFETLAANSWEQNMQNWSGLCQGLASGPKVLEISIVLILRPWLVNITCKIDLDL